MNEDVKWVVECFDLDTNEWRLYTPDRYDSYEEAENDVGGPLFFSAGVFRIMRRLQVVKNLLPVGTHVWVRGRIEELDPNDPEAPYLVAFESPRAHGETYHGSDWVGPTLIREGDVP